GCQGWRYAAVGLHAASRIGAEALGIRVDVALRRSQETGQSQSRTKRQIDCKAGRGADGGEYGDSRAQGLLNELVAGPPAQQNDVRLGRKPSGNQTPSHELVE